MAHGIPRRPEDAWTRFSATKVSTLLSCARHGFLSHIVPSTVPLNPFAAHGITLHSLFQQFFTRHPSTRRFPYLTKKAFLNAWYGQWTGAVNGEHGFSGRGAKHPPQEVSWEGRIDLPDSMMKSGMKFISQFFDHHDHIRHDRRHRRVEAGFVFPWANRFVLSGIIDRMEKDPDGAIITDYKPGHYSEPMLVGGIQLLFYQEAYREYFRRQQRWQVPLKGLHIYDYKSATTREGPLRGEQDYGLFAEILTELQIFLQVALTGIKPANWRSVSFPRTRLDKADAERGDIRPRLPRDKHCEYCPHLRACLSWEAGKEPTARQHFQEYWKKPQPALIMPPTKPPQTAAHRQGRRLGRQARLSNDTIQISMNFEEPPT